MPLLQPGTYLIELETTRPVEASSLGRVLGAMGFSRVVPDQMPPQHEAQVGALPGMAAARSSATTSAPSGMRRSSTMMQPGAVMPKATAKPTTPAATRISPHVYAPGGRATTKTTKTDTAVDPSTKQAEFLPRYVPPDSRQETRYKRAALAPAGAKKPKEPGMFDFGPGGGAPPEPQPGEPQPGEPIPGEVQPGGEQPGPYDYGSPPLGPGPKPGGGGSFPGGEGGGGYMPGGASPSEYLSSYQERSYSDEGVVLRSLWQAWKDFGTPFAGTSTSGAPCNVPIGEIGTFKTRMLAELRTAIRTNDTPDIRWVSIIPVFVKPFEALILQIQPYQLRTGKTYEIRFLSRARSTATREAVERMLQAMGWRVDRLTAIKRHIRLPGRAGAQLSLWYGIGTWQKPDSVIVADDPFYFEDVRAVEER